jgi:glycosyltransferase involved in cell wall biosynthesis
VAGGAALLAPPGDADRLAEAIEAALPGDADRRRLGLEVAARHTWDASAAAHAEVYRSVG